MQDVPAPRVPGKTRRTPGPQPDPRGRPPQASAGGWASQGEEAKDRATRGESVYFAKGHADKGQATQGAAGLLPLGAGGGASHPDLLDLTIDRERVSDQALPSGIPGRPQASPQLQCIPATHRPGRPENTTNEKTSCFHLPQQSWF